jgi:glycosyltransferase involved in cell wall biosynthesis
MERELTDKQLSTSATRFAIMRELSGVQSIYWGSNSLRCLINYQRIIGFESKSRLLHNITPEPTTFPCNAVPAFGSYDTKSFTVISVMRLSEEKRPSLFLELARNFQSRKDIQFLLIGSGPLEAMVKAKLETLELKNFVWIHNTLRVGYHLKLSSIYVMTSSVEGSPNAVLEASMVGLPVVVADVGGLKEIYSHLENAIFVSDKNDLQCYVDSVQLLLDDEKLRRKLSQAGSSHVRRRHGGIRTQITIEALLN